MFSRDVIIKVVEKDNKDQPMSNKIPATLVEYFEKNYLYNIIYLCCSGCTDDILF